MTGPRITIKGKTLSVSEWIGWLKHADHYYYNDTPKVSDSLYDHVRILIQNAIPNHPYFKDVGSPVTDSHLSKVTFSIPMPSLVKIRPGMAYAWGVSIFDITRESKFVLSLKLDGISLRLEYKDDKLVRATTRGNGIEGQDVTANALLLSGVPREVSFSKYGLNHVFVYGETIINKSIFSHMFPEMSAPRSFVNGQIKAKLDSAVRRRLASCMFVACGVSLETYRATNLTVSKFKQLQELGNLGFITLRRPIHAKYDSSGTSMVRRLDISSQDDLGRELDAIKIKYGEPVRLVGIEPRTNLESQIEKLFKLSQEIDLECDGVVIETDDCKARESLGINNGRSVGARAIKLDTDKQENSVAIIRDIEWSVSKAGVLEPVANFLEPVLLGGVEVSRATCVHAKNISELGLGKGTHVSIIRSGDVIPRIMKVVRRGNHPTFPKKCPSCGAVTERTDTDVICRNMRCMGRQVSRVYAMLTIFKVKGIGKATVEKMCRGLKSTRAILTATPEDFRKLGFGPKESRDFHDAIKEGISSISKCRLMHASGCFSTSEASLAEDRLERIKSAFPRAIECAFTWTKVPDISEWPKIPTIGPALIALFIENAPAFSKFYYNINDIVNIDEKIGKYTGKTFCMTGTRHPGIKEAIEKEGGKVSESLTKSTYVLIALDPKDRGIKIDKARKYGVKIVPLARALDIFGLKE